MDQFQTLPHASYKNRKRMYSLCIVYNKNELANNYNEQLICVL